MASTNTQPSVPRVVWLWPTLILVLLIAAGPVLLIAYIVVDWEFVRGTLRGLQIIGLVALGALALGLCGLVAVGIAGLWTRWASPRARDAGAMVAVARARWPHLPDDARVTLSLGAPARERETIEQAPFRLEGPITPPADAAHEDESAPALALPPVGQTLKSLERQGLICRSGNSLLVGLNRTTGVPVYIEINDACLITLGGAPQTGKTSLALFLIAQAAMMGWSLYLCDPHGRHERGIIARGLPLSGAFNRQAIEQHEILAAITAFDELGRSRINGDPDRTPALLVIDEFPAQTLSGELGGAMELLIRIGSQYPKVGLFIIAIGYEWNAQLFASRYAAPLRNLSRHRAVAQSDPRSAAFLIGERLAHQAAQLAVGEVLFVARGVFGVVHVPLIGHDDLVYAAGGVAPRPYETPSVPLDDLEAPEEEDSQAGAASALTVLTLDERIIDILGAADAPLASGAIIEATGGDKQQVYNALNRLVDSGQVRRSGSRRAYTYALLTHRHSVSLEA